jgi:hypothetical protein
MVGDHANEFVMDAFECAVLTRFHDLYAALGFPHAREIEVVGRMNTPCGRHLDFLPNRMLQIPDGYLDLQGLYIEMEGVEKGMMAVACVEKGTLRFMEITTYGGEAWDGLERPWTFR